MAEHLKVQNTALEKPKNSSTDIIPSPSNKPAFKNRTLLSEVVPSINLPTEADRKIFMKALERFEITERELNDGFWEAYADPYVPSSGVEFRHLWKHIEEMRKGSGRKLFTYREVLNACDKEKITTDAFEFLDSIQKKEVSKNPEIDKAEIRCWKRK